MGLKRTSTPRQPGGLRDTSGLSLMQYITRALYSQYLGKQYGGDRDLYEALGYPTDITYAQYWQQYSRQDIAGAIINRPVEQTWKGRFYVNNAEDKAGVLKDAWTALSKQLRLKEKFIRVDKLSSLGRFGILLLGFSDIRNAQTDFATPVGSPRMIRGNAIPQTNLQLKYVVPYGEDKVQIVEWVTDAKNERYGMPLIYSVSQTTETGALTVLRVHYSRVLHITGEKLDSETYGVPVLQRVFNRLMDIEKLVGGSAEMFWRGARPGYAGKVDKDYTPTAEDEAALGVKLKEYENNLRRILIAEGVDFHALEQQIADPQNPLDVQMQMIAAITGIPKRILMGSELGELASTQDRNSWISYVTTRREEYAEGQIVEPFVDMLMELGVLPKQDYQVEWPDLASVSDKDKAEVGAILSKTIAEYASQPMAQEVMPLKSFMKYILKLSDEQVEAIKQDREEALRELDIPEEEEEEEMPIEDTEEETDTDEEE